MSAVNDKRRQRLKWVILARGYADRACESLGGDGAVSAAESRVALNSYGSLSNWLRHLEGDLGRNKPPVRGPSSTNAGFVRIEARLDKLEALFEKLAEQGATQRSWREHLERRVLCKIGPLQEAVRFLLATQDPESADPYLRAIWAGDAPKEPAEISEDTPGEPAPQAGADNAPPQETVARLDQIMTRVEAAVDRANEQVRKGNEFVLGQIAPLQSAVLLLLAREAPSLTEKVRAGKAIVAAADPQPPATES